MCAPHPVQLWLRLSCLSHSWLLVERWLVLVPEDCRFCFALLHLRVSSGPICVTLLLLPHFTDSQSVFPRFSCFSPSDLRILPCEIRHSRNGGQHPGLGPPTAVERRSLFLHQCDQARQAPQICLPHFPRPLPTFGHGPCQSSADVLQSRMVLQ